MQDIQRVKDTKEIAYLIKYSDGDFEHFTAEQVFEYLSPEAYVDSDVPVDSDEGIVEDSDDSDFECIFW